MRQVQTILRVYTYAFISWHHSKVGLYSELCKYVMKCLPEQSFVRKFRNFDMICQWREIRYGSTRIRIKFFSPHALPKTTITSHARLPQGIFTDYKKHFKESKYSTYLFWKCIVYLTVTSYCLSCQSSYKARFVQPEMYAANRIPLVENFFEMHL